MVGVWYTICHWATNRIDPQNLLSITLDVPLHLPSLLICTVVHQVTLFSSFTGNLHCCVSGHCAPFLQQWDHSQLTFLTACSNFIPIYPNLFEFILNLFEFCRDFWVKREVMWQSCLVSSESAAIFPHWSRIHTRQGFHPGLRPGLWSLCWSQSATLPSYNSLWNSK